MLKKFEYKCSIGAISKIKGIRSASFSSCFGKVIFFQNGPPNRRHVTLFIHMRLYKSMTIIQTYTYASEAIRGHYFLSSHISCLFVNANPSFDPKRRDSRAPLSRRDFDARGQVECTLSHTSSLTSKRDCKRVPVFPRAPRETSLLGVLGQKKAKVRNRVSGNTDTSGAMPFPSKSLSSYVLRN